jgi:elongation factor 3
MIMGRQKLKKSFQYEVKWRGLDHKLNTWVPRDDLLGKGYTKLVQQFDDLESSREGAGSRETSAVLVRKHLEDIGLDGDIAQYNEISGLSGGRPYPLLTVCASFLFLTWHPRSKDQIGHSCMPLEQSPSLWWI